MPWVQIESTRDKVVLAAGAVAALLILWVLRDRMPASIIAAVVTAVSTPMAVIDFNEHRLPNTYTGPLAAFATIAVLALGVIEDDLRQAIVAIGLGMVAFAVTFVLSLGLKIGMGDVKFAYPLAAVLGWFGAETLQVAAVVMFLAAGVYTVAVLVRSRTASTMIPFGPFMAVGFVAGVLSAA